MRPCGSFAIATSRSIRSPGCAWARAGKAVHAIAVLVILEPRPLSSFGLSVVQHHVHGQPVQPGAERALAAKQVQLLPRANEHVLRQLLGARAVGDHPRAEREDPVDVLTVEPLECAPIARGREGHIGVGAWDAGVVSTGSDRATAVIGRRVSLGALDGIPERVRRFEVRLVGNGDTLGRASAAR